MFGQKGNNAVLHVDVFNAVEVVWKTMTGIRHEMHESLGLLYLGRPVWLEESLFCAIRNRMI